MNEILRRSTPQNDVKWGVVIASEPRNSGREIPMLFLVRASSPYIGCPSLNVIASEAKQSPRFLTGDCHVALVGFSQ